MTRQSQLNAEESFSIFSNEMTVAELLNGTECHILIDSGATKSFMSKHFYLNINVYTPFLNLLVIQRICKLVMVNLLVCYLLFLL